MIQGEIIILGKRRLTKRFQKTQAEVAKDFFTAVRVESFRLRKGLQTDIRGGHSAGIRFDPLSFLAKINLSSLRVRKSKRPLTKLAHGVKVTTVSKNPPVVEIGFTKDSSPSYRRLADKHQKGFTTRVTKKQRKFLAKRGGTLSKRSGNKKKIFFIKKTTKVMKSEPRKIIGPFWRLHRRQALQNISVNMGKKLQGMRI